MLFTKKKCVMMLMLIQSEWLELFRELIARIRAGANEAVEGDERELEEIVMLRYVCYPLI